MRGSNTGASPMLDVLFGFETDGNFLTMPVMVSA